MKARAKRLWVKLPQVCLYMEDIDEIVAKMRSACSELRFSDETHEFESLEEMKDKRGCVTGTLEITGYIPVTAWMSLDIRADGTTLSTDGCSDAMVGVWYYLRDYLSKRVRAGFRLPVMLSPFWSGFLDAFLYSALFWVSVIVIAVTAYNYGSKGTVPLPIKENPKLASLYFAFLALAILRVVTSIWPKKKGSLVYLEPKCKVRSFWQANRDKIYLVIITATITAIITLVVSWLGGRILG